MKRVADVVIDFVSHLGSKKIFVLTGNGAMYINDAIQTSPIIDYVCVRNETVAPLAASAYFQNTGKPGVVCVTAGPGAANAIPGVIEAWVENSNIFILSGQVPNSEMTKNSSTERKNLKTFGIAGIPITDYVKEFTKFSYSLSSSAELPHVLREIYEQFKQGTPGPVWLDIPLDVQSHLAPDVDLNKLLNEGEKFSEVILESKLDQKALDYLKTSLDQANRPIIILGTGAFRNNSLEDIISWLGHTGIPFALSRSVVDMIPLSIPGNLGVIGVRGRPWSKKVFQDTDLLIGVGTRFPSSMVGPDFSYLNKFAKVIMVNTNRDELKRFSLNTDTHIWCNAELFIESGEIRKVFASYKNKYQAWFQNLELVKKLTQTKRQNLSKAFLDIYWFCENIEKFLTEDCVLTSDAGSNYYACGQAMTYNNRFREVTSGTFAAMGVSLPFAIGSAVSDKNIKRVVCITGDGSIELNIQELLTVVTYNLNIAIFVINNGGYASMRTWQDKFFESRYIGSTDNTGAKPMNFEKISNAFGIDYELIQNEYDFMAKINQIINSKNPILIEVICNPNQLMELPMEADLV